MTSGAATSHPRWHRSPRAVHPGAWWVWALLLAGAASATTNPLLLLLLLAVTTFVVLCRRGDGPWARSFRLYLVLGAFVVGLRLFYRVVFGGGDGGAVVLALPEITLPGAVSGVRLLGDVTSDALVHGLQDGLRLATLIVCVGAANALANPRRLLAAVPPALYELGAVLTVAVTVFAQLADSLLRVRRARALRPAPTGRGVRHRHRVVRTLVVPVLTDALDRSLLLAASMDARGYGRHTGTRRQRGLTAVLLLVALVLIGFAGYAVLARALPVLGPPRTGIDTGWLVLAAGVGVAAIGFVHAGRGVRRTRYRPDPWRGAEWATVTAGLVCYLAVQVVLRGPEAGVLVPGARDWPTLVPLLVLAVAAAALPAVLTPPPALDQAPVVAVGGVS